MAEQPETAQVTDEELIALFEEVKNWGRWGDDDELGTLNYITPDVRRRAAALVQTGESLSLSRPLLKGPGKGNRPRLDHHLAGWPGEPWATFDYVGIACHGFDMTHLDAIAHCTWEGQVYNGRRLETLMTHDGASFGSVSAMRDGILTRGVLMDFAASQGVEWVDPEGEITAADLDRAAEYAGVTVESGDALLLRVGLAAHEQHLGHRRRRVPSVGLVASAIRWLHEHEVSVVGGDCNEKIPYSTPRFDLPLHQIGLPAMGLMLLDWPDVEPLADKCRALSRFEFLLTVAPLPLQGGTGMAVNPIATF